MQLWARGLTLLVVCCVVIGQARAEDWPMWRYDAARSAASTEQLPAELHLQWTRQFSPRKQAWDDALNLDLMSYDRVFEPVIKDGRLFLGFNDRDKLVAYDLETGRELWSYYADGPVRLPPVAWKDRVFFASDDGHLYCLDAAKGTLLWRFRGGPNSRQILGNQRLVSAWPMRGGPVVRDGKVYCAASIWPFMGTFIYALDAESGAVQWVNDETGSQYIKQPHSAPSFAGVAPQGALVATENILLVPGGRSVPAAFDRHNGKMLYFELNAGGKGTGGSFLAANDQSWFVHTRIRGTREFSLDAGVKTAFQPNEPVLAGERIYSAEYESDKSVVRGYDTETKQILWETAVDGRGDLILAGDTLYAAGAAVKASSQTTPSGTASVASDDLESVITAIKLPHRDGQPSSLWSAKVPGTAQRLIAANGKLVVITLEGNVFTFGAAAQTASTAITETMDALITHRETASTVDALLKAAAAEGYAYWIGAGDEQLVKELAARRAFAQLAIVDEDSGRVERLRKAFDAAGLYGSSTAHVSSLAELLPPPYVANMLFVGTELSNKVVDDAGALNRLYETVRPYGGALLLLAEREQIESMRQRAVERGLERAEVETCEQGVIIRRVGALPGAGTWTHQHGNVANTIKSDDQRVKLPLGVLWFGGVSHDDVLPRHGHGPPEQVIGGRLFIQGINTLTARDVYTGRVLWRREFADLGTHDVYFDDTYQEAPLNPAYNQVHIPGANARGTNYVVTADRVYILEGSICHVLNAATGETMTDIQLPQADPSVPNEWGYIGIYQDVLIGGVGFAKYRTRHSLDDSADGGTSGAGSKPKKTSTADKILDRSASMALVGFDRHTGKQLWKVDALHSFWHNGIVAGNGMVYVLDKNPKPVEEFLKRRGKSNPDTYRLMAFDAQTGRRAWELPGKVFGTWLGYSETHDLLLQAGAAASDRLSAEVGQGMAVYRGSNGELVWEKADLKYSGPCVLHNDLIITNANSYSESAGAFRLTDGSQKLVKNSLTGKLQPWKITRAYGCNSIIASENLLTFRSGAAGFYDLLTEGGTGNFGGFKSGCTSNLVVADGVLNAPDYTRTCSCAYQNQTSLALVHMPEMDAWTISNTEILDANSGRVQQLSINIGAPGDRRDAYGRMWLEYPPVAGDSPNLGLEFSGNAHFFQDHPTALASAARPHDSEAIAWVASSGVEGLSSLRVGLTAMPTHRLSTGLPIEHADDDAEESASGAVNLESSTLDMVETAEGQQLVGLRFNNIHLARGAEIRSAALQFSCRTPSSDATELIIRAEVGNADRFSTEPRSLSSRKMTTSEVRWTPAEWKKEGDAQAAQRTPDLAPLIREVVSSEDWKPGNSIVFIISGTGKRLAAPLRGKDNVPATLTVDADETSPAQDKSVEQVPYRVRLHFGVPRNSLDQERRFDVSIMGQPAVKDIAIGGSHPATAVHTIKRIHLGDRIELSFTPHVGQPVLSGLEIIRLDE